MEAALSPFFLVYASTAARPFSDDELRDLLTTARAVNLRLDITGLLLYAPGAGDLPGTFVQYLEGPPAAVRDLYARIAADPRHRECTLLREGPTFRRKFSDWTMGFRNLGSLDLGTIPGYNASFGRDWTLTRVLAEPDPVLQTLYSFAAP
jgi:hypothetical protein